MYKRQPLSLAYLTHGSSYVDGLFQSSFLSCLLQELALSQARMIKKQTNNPLDLLSKGFYYYKWLIIVLQYT